MFRVEVSEICKVSSYISEKRVKERRGGQSQRPCHSLSVYAAPGFDPKSEYVGFLLDEVELGRAFPDKSHSINCSTIISHPVARRYRFSMLTASLNIKEKEQEWPMNAMDEGELLVTSLLYLY